ncbi:putative membrane protein [Phascolomyces articulosus]|uniref:GDT1 family protein n=1 Tax=Phascolomyces articulosus TaxID=60185 RepID=A0AAD5KDN2_9FUNG|nr:putative membrane protein [Phascolomyces articulosus]
MIGISEIGDKTFLIAAVMAMKHPRWAVFTGAFSALCLMAVVSSLLGRVVPQLIPKNYTDMIAAILFFFFGLRMAWEAHCMKKQEQQHYTAVDKTDDEDIEDMTTIYHENNKAEYQGSLSEDEYEHEEKKIRQKQQPVLVEAFILTFLGEWGDKSQISTIALAASNDVLWVTIGVIVGHGICTGLAVLGGRLIADRISVRTVAMVGSFMFILFGCVYIHHAIYLQE